MRESSLGWWWPGWHNIMSADQGWCYHNIGVVARRDYLITGPNYYYSSSGSPPFYWHTPTPLMAPSAHVYSHWVKVLLFYVKSCLCLSWLDWFCHPDVISSHGDVWFWRNLNNLNSALSGEKGVGLVVVVGWLVVTRSVCSLPLEMWKWIFPILVWWGFPIVAG